MDDYKIIQIIPNNQELYARYKDDEDDYFTCKIVCFALVEYKDGSRDILPMEIYADGSIDNLSDELECIVSQAII